MRERSLTRAYVIAVTVIAVLATLTLVTGQYAVDEANRWSTIINDSGRQRMLIQRVLVFAGTAAHQGAADSRAEADLRSAIDEAEGHHRNLVQTVSEALEKGAGGDRLEALYFSDDGIDAALMRFLRDADEITAESLDREARQQAFADLLNVNDSILLPKLEQAVDRFEDLSMRDNRFIGRIQIVTYVAMLIVLLIQVVFIFRPVVRRIAETIENLETAKAQAVAANEAKSAFLSMMTHEIRTPLNGILGSVELLERVSIPSEGRRWFASIKSSSLALLGIVNDVLDISKIEAGALDVEMHPLDIGALVAQVGTMFRAHGQKSGVDFQVQVDVGEAATINSDTVRLRQILVNLLGNAFKFTEKGQVSLSVSVKADASSQNGGLVLTIVVADTGIGIAPERLEWIFERFTQADETITRRFGGTGLGLPLVKSLCEALGGRITVTSQIGQGSEFTVTLPVEAVALARQESDATDIPVTVPMNRHVLIAEDIDLNAQLLKAFIADFGWTTALVVNGRQAVEYLANGNAADVVFMDIHMPEMDGVAATKRIRALDIKQPFIFGLTADGLLDEHRKYREAGMDEVLLKPFSPTIIGEALALASANSPTNSN